jgi:hypothetical protein
MDSFEDLIKRMAKALNDAGVDYMFTGALAASYYGTPRTTMDMDVIVRFSPANTKRLTVQLRKAGMSVSARKIREAFESGFRVVTLEDKKSPFTVDIMLSDKRLEKTSGTIFGLPTFYQTPEALVSSKLRMIKATIPRERALKDRDDVRAILRYTQVDLKAVKRRAQRENTVSILEELVASD